MNETETEITKLVSLFHTEEMAQAAIEDLQNAGIPISSIQKTSGGNDASSASFSGLSLPTEDLKMLSDGVRSGGTVITVTAEGGMADEAEDIFKRHHAGKVDERIVRDSRAALPVSAMAETELEGGEQRVPIIEEELVLGKREVRTGGVRVVSHVVDRPVAESVTLREEHAIVERHPVNREATAADFGIAQNRPIEVVTETEEAVVSKAARVVEEIVVGKESGERAHSVTETVRRTEVEVENIPADETKAAKLSKPRV